MSIPSLPFKAIPLTADDKPIEVGKTYWTRSDEEWVIDEVFVDSMDGCKCTDPALVVMGRVRMYKNPEGEFDKYLTWICWNNLYSTKEAAEEANRKEDECPVKSSPSKNSTP